MKRIKILSVLFVIVFALNSVVLADGAFYSSDEKSHIEAVMNAFPEMSAESYAVMDSRTGEVLFADNESKSLPIASTTKMMTALVVVENTDSLDKLVAVDAESCGIEGSSVNLYKGEKISIRDLLYALMLESANDAAVCLARNVAGSVEEFSTLMNKRASELKMTGTHFTNPHGLEDKDHYSTALDMALLWQEAMKNDVIREIVATKTYKIPLGGDNGYRFLSNHNKLLKNYEPCIGGKTGFTKAAGRCLVTVCEKNGVELITVTLNDPNDWDDHKNITEYAFSNYVKTQVAEAGKISVEIPVVGGKKNSVTLVNRESLDLWVRDITKLETRIEAPHFLYAPVNDADTATGKVVFYYNGKEIGSIGLFSLDEVEIHHVKPGFFKRIWNFITGK